MKKVFIIMIIAVFMLSGCGDDKNTSTTERTEPEAAATPVQQTPKPDKTPASTESTVAPTMQPTQPAATPQDTAAATQTKEELEELSNALEGLTGGDFSDIDYSE
jgi:PBP1b-binding outer membrane lipoprotein LpoB